MEDWMNVCLFAGVDTMVVNLERRVSSAVVTGLCFFLYFCKYPAKYDLIWLTELYQSSILQQPEAFSD